MKNYQTPAEAAGLCNTVQKEWDLSVVQSLWTNISQGKDPPGYFSNTGSFHIHKNSVALQSKTALL